MFTASKFYHTEMNVPVIDAELVSDAYKVFVNGEEACVYSCRISAIPFNRPWPGHQRPIDQTAKVSFVNIVSDEELHIEVIPKKTDYEKIMLKPYSKKVNVKKKGDKLCFTIKAHGGYVLELDDHTTALYIFNTNPIAAPKREDVTYYFGEGIHHVGRLTLKSNESVYVDTNALVFGNIFAENAENIHVFGNGIFNDSTEERVFEHCYMPFTSGNVKLYDCKNVKIEGVGFTNSAIWCVNIFHCFDVEIDSIKVFGEWRYNTDGIDVVNSQRVSIKNTFVHSFDDTIVIKGIDRFLQTSTTDVLVENCVLCCEWGRTCELGFETACREFKNITFRNCDIIRAAHTALSIHNGDCAEIHGVLFENISLELESFYTKHQVQKRDDEVYSQTDVEPTILFGVNNSRFRDSYPLVAVDYAVGAPSFAGAHDIEARNISVYCDEKLLSEKGTKIVRVNMRNIIPTTEFYNISLKNVTLNGKALTADDVDFEIEEKGSIKNIDIL